MKKNKNYFFSEDTSEEVQEWLGITKADILMFVALGLVMATWVIQIKIIQSILIISMAILCYYSSKLGMKHNPNVSKFTNIMKVITYPLSSVILIGAAIFALIK